MLTDEYPREMYVADATRALDNLRIVTAWQSDDGLSRYLRAESSTGSNYEVSAAGRIVGDRDRPGWTVTWTVAVTNPWKNAYGGLTPGWFYDPAYVAEHLGDLTRRFLHGGDLAVVTVLVHMLTSTLGVGIEEAVIRATAEAIAEVREAL